MKSITTLLRAKAKLVIFKGLITVTIRQTHTMKLLFLL
jgi:hypothetical protein